MFCPYAFSVIYSLLSHPQEAQSCLSHSHTQWLYYMSSAWLQSPLQAAWLLSLKSYFLPVHWALAKLCLSLFPKHVSCSLPISPWLVSSCFLWPKIDCDLPSLKVHGIFQNFLHGISTMSCSIVFLYLFCQLIEDKAFVLFKCLIEPKGALQIESFNTFLRIKHFNYCKLRLTQILRSKA